MWRKQIGNERFNGNAAVYMAEELINQTGKNVKRLNQNHNKKSRSEKNIVRIGIPK